MPRLHLFEIMDQSWCPRIIRDAATAYIEWYSRISGLFGPALSLIIECQQKTNSQLIVDLCSGGGGPWLHLRSRLLQLSPDAAVVLTDLYPNQQTLSQIAKQPYLNLTYDPQPMPAHGVHYKIPHMRTMFFGLHHFREPEIRTILEDAIQANSSICFFDGCSRLKWFGILTSIFVPFLVLISSPFWRPFRFSNILLSLAFLLPMVVFFDSLVSWLRFYSDLELRSIIAKLPNKDLYEWKVGNHGEGFLKMTYLLGWKKCK